MRIFAIRSSGSYVQTGAISNIMVLLLVQDSVDKEVANAVADAI